MTEMAQSRRYRWTCLALLLGWTAPAAMGETFVIAVGVSHVEGGGVQDLPQADGDALKIHTYYRDQGASQTWLMTSLPPEGILHRRPTSSEIRLVLNEVERSCRANDTVIVYFACHGLGQIESDANGATVIKEVYLLTLDAELRRNDRGQIDGTGWQKLSRTALPLSELRERLDGMRAANRLLLLDCCTAAEYQGRGLRPKMLDCGRAAVFLACQFGGTAYEWKSPDGKDRGGAFTHFLLDTLATINQPDRPMVRLQDLKQPVIDAVTKWARGAKLEQVPLLDPPDADFPVLRKLGGVFFKVRPEIRSQVEIFLDDQRLGPADKDYNVPAGQNRFVLRHGSRELPVTLDVAPGGLVSHKVEFPPAVGQLRVTVKPLETRVLVDGKVVADETPWQGEVPSGKHVVRLEPRDRGFEPYQEEVEVPEGIKPFELRKNLDPRRGAIRVVSDPPGAAVRIDGNHVGQTGTDLQLSVGEHTATVSLPGYEPKTLPLIVEPEGRAAEVIVKLVASPVPVTVKTVPTGAALSVDGTSVAQVTDCTVSLLPGRHVLRAELAGRLPHQETVELLPAQPLTVGPWNLPEPAPGRVRVTSEPPGADLVVDAGLKGRTDTELELKPGRHTIVFRLPGYVEETREVEARSEQAGEPVHVVLRPRPAVLTVVTNPAGAKVTINGEKAEGDPLRRELPPGQVRVRAEAAGREPAEAVETLQPGEERSITLVLLPPAPGQIQIRSIPSGARVLDGDTVLGETPLPLKRAPGRYHYQVALAGYREATVQFVIQAKQTTPAVTAELEPLPVTVTFESDPAGAQILIDGEDLGRPTPCEHTLLPGSYRVEARKPPNRPVEAQMVVSAGQPVRWRRELPAPGPVRVTVESVPSGAAVVIDGRRGQERTTAVLELQIGPHTIGVELPGYRPAEQAITIAPEAAPAPVRIQLVPLPVAVTVASEPAGAAVFVDGRDTGRKTPCSVELMPGQARLGLVLGERYAPLERVVSVTAGAAPELGVLKLDEAVGQVFVDTDPDGATVLLGQRTLGVTPGTFPLPVGEHRLTLRLPGCREQSVTATVQRGEVTRLQPVKMTLVPGVLVVASNPPGANVLVNGKDSGKKTDCKLEVPSGELKVTLQKEGHQSFETTVRVGPGETVELPIHPLPKLDLPKDWPSDLPDYRPAAGVQIRVSPKDRMPQVLVPAGKVLLGAVKGDRAAAKDEADGKEVTLDAFWMDVHEVTVEQYLEFCAATRRRMPAQPGYSTLRHPVINVSFDDAQAYAAWAGRRLPTEAQFQRAARGAHQDWLYPWGTQPPDATRANYRGAADGQEFLAPVATYPANEFGLYDLAGNVGEWGSERYRPDWYKVAPERNPVQDKDHSIWVEIRPVGNGDVEVHEHQIPLDFRQVFGGSWLDEADGLRVSNRSPRKPTWRDVATGFRCVESVAR